MEWVGCGVYGVYRVKAFSECDVSGYRVGCKRFHSGLVGMVVMVVFCYGS